MGGAAAADPFKGSVSTRNGMTVNEACAADKHQRQRPWPAPDSQHSRPDNGRENDICLVGGCCLSATLAGGVSQSGRHEHVPCMLCCTPGREALSAYNWRVMQAASMDSVTLKA